MAAMAATGAVATDTARGRLRPSLATAMAAMVATGVVVMEVTAVDTARGRPRLSPAMAMAVMAAAMVAMVAAAMAAMVATATGVSYHRRRRSELSQKQNHTKIVIVEAVKT